MDTTITLIAMVSVAAFCFYMAVRAQNKRLDVLEDQNNDLCPTVHSLDTWSKRVVPIWNETIQAICPHEEWDYTKAGRTWTRVSITGVTTEEDVRPICYDYHKTCPICIKKVQITKAEYEEAIKAEEMADIEEARKDLEARQKAVVSG